MTVTSIGRLLLIFTLLVGVGDSYAQTYEVGVITVEQPNATTWFKVSFEQTYPTPPVVIAGPLSEFNQDPSQIRIRNVDATGFEYQVEEFEYLDGLHGEETFSYLAIEQGRHIIDGKVWEAGIVTGNTDGSFKSVSFTGVGFSSDPIIFKQLATNNDPTMGVLRIKGITTNEFAVKIDEEEGSANLTRTASDEIHYLAVEPGNGVIGSGTESKDYQIGTASADDQGQDISFASFNNPILIAGSRAALGADPFVVRYDHLSSTGARLRLQEEQSQDSETSHFSEEIAYLVIESEAPDYRQVLWLENFDTDDNDQADDGPTAWSVNMNSTTSIQTQRLTSTNDEAIWMSETIPIAGYTGVKLSVDLSSTGELETDDYLEIYYKLDNGPETPLLNGLWLGNIGDNVTAMISGLTGNTVELIAKFRTDDGAETYHIDNVRVYTESDERHAISSSGWRDLTTWSYTADGPPCSCIPDLLSKTYIDGQTVQVNSFTRANTNTLTVLGGGILTWATDFRALTMWGDAKLDIQAGSQLNRGTVTSNTVRFAQWNSRLLANDQTRTGLNYPGVSVTLNVDNTNGLQVSNLFLDANGTYHVEGDGSIAVVQFLNINHKATITNNLTGLLAVGNNVQLNFPNISIINNASITSTFIRFGQRNILLDNRTDGLIHISAAIQLWGDDVQIVNEGTITTVNLTLSASSASKTTIINRGTFEVDENIFGNNKELTLRNHATVATNGNITGVMPSKFLFYNYEGAQWYFGSEVIDKDLYLFANEIDNEVHYHGTTNQSILTPRDLNNPVQTGSYYHLTLSNRYLDTNNPTVSRKIVGHPLDINGNVTIIGTLSGNTQLDVAQEGVNLTVAGDWRQRETDGNYSEFIAGSEQETVTFDGISTQTIFTNERFNNLIIDKEGTDRLQLSEGSQVTGQVTFAEGIVEVASDHTLLFTSTARALGASGTSHVVGTVAKQGRTDFTFPVGDGTAYRPISVSGITLATNQQLSAQYFNTLPPNVNLRQAEITNLGACNGHWNIASPDVMASAFVKLHWSKECNINPSRVIVAHWDSTQWVSEGRGTVSGNPITGTVTTPVVMNRLGLFALAEVLEPLSIPKGFSPNGDQYQDTWTVTGIEGYIHNKVTIFNRWGSTVFEASGYDNDNIFWSGESSQELQVGNNQLPDGVYFYVIDLGEGQKPLSGFIVLKR